MKAILSRILFAWRYGTDTSRARALARHAAATAIQWPEGTPFLVNPSPEIRDRVGVVLLGTITCVAVMLTISASPLPRYFGDRALRPAMEAAMQAGNTGAATWLGARFDHDYPGLLEAQADAGEPTAMYLVGRALMRSANPAHYYQRAAGMTREQQLTLALDFVRGAAAAGNEDALLLLIDRGERLTDDADVTTLIARAPALAGSN